MPNILRILKSGPKGMFGGGSVGRVASWSTRVVGKLAAPILGLTVGAWLIQQSSPVLASCEASQIVYKQIADAHVLQYPANNPIEDRYAYACLKSIPAKLAVILDGHGGFAVC